MWDQHVFSHSVPNCCVGLAAGRHQGDSSARLAANSILTLAMESGGNALSINQQLGEEHRESGDVIAVSGVSATEEAHRTTHADIFSTVFAHVETARDASRLLIASIQNRISITWSSSLEAAQVFVSPLW